MKRVSCNGNSFHFLRTVYKPHSVRQQVPGRSSLWAACRHTARCGLPGTGALPVEGAHMEASSLPPSADDFVPAWPCSQRGLPGHAHYCARRWSLTPPFHHHLPLPAFPKSNGFGEGARRAGGLAVCFCGPFRQVHASRRFPRPGCYPTPCSMECGLSSTPTTQGRDRPTDLRHFHHNRIMPARQLPTLMQLKGLNGANFKKRQ